MDKKVKKIFEVAVKYFPGPHKNPSLKYKRKEFCRDIINIMFTKSQVDEAIALLKDIDE